MSPTQKRIDPEYAALLNAVQRAAAKDPALIAILAADLDRAGHGGIARTLQAGRNDGGLMAPVKDIRVFDDGYDDDDAA